MEAVHLVHHLLTLALLVLLSAAFIVSFHDHESEDDDDGSNFCKFERVTEAKRECSSFMSSASQLDLTKLFHVADSGSLSFENGDWMQEASGAPLMPFDDSDMPKNLSGLAPLLKLVSFSLIEFDFKQEIENAVGVCGYMEIGITRNATLYKEESWDPGFYATAGTSQLGFPLEGLYMESKENEGERVLCLLGSSLWPFSKEITAPFEEKMEYGYGCKSDLQSPLAKDDRVMLVLRYPANFSLTRRAILGGLRSLNEKSDSKYFDKVQILSQLGYRSSYQFASEKLVAKACNPYPYPDELIDDGIQLFQGSKFCEIFRKFEEELFDIISDSEGDYTKEHYSNLGPFLLGSETKAINGTLNNLKLMMTDVRCAPGNDRKFKTVKAAAVFRLISPSENQNTARRRTGFSGKTLFAEGTWNSSSGQLCMVGCVGLVETGSDQCESRICLYLPVSLSISHQSIVVGTITSIGSKNSFNPLLIKKVLRPLDLRNKYHDYATSHLSYKYSKTELASALLKKNEVFNLVAIMKQSFLKYPTVDDMDNKTSVSLLFDELSFDTYARPRLFYYKQPSETYVKFEILSLGSLLGRYWSFQMRYFQKQDSKHHADPFYSARQELFLNVSAQLILDNKYYSNVSELFLEGVYNLHSGNMHLIGCRNMNLESKMDCSIEVRVEYSSKNFRWLKNPSAKVSIASQRNVEDPLYFRPISLQTLVITYSDNSKEYLFRRNFELVFRVLVLISSIACSLSQLSYMGKMADVVPFVSVVMLAIQALGFGLPLVTNAIILFKWKEFHYKQHLDYGQWRPIWFQGLECTTKFLLLFAFMLTLRLCQKVWKSRSGLHGSKPMNLKQNAREKTVFLLTLTIHVVGFLIVHTFYSKNPKEIVASDNLYLWLTELDEYMRIVQDFFLLPQIIINFMWHVQGKPTRKVFYIGYTCLRLLVRIYDYTREPVFSYHLHDRTFNPSSELPSKSADFVIMSTLALLAVIVHIQHSWNCKSLDHVMNSMQANLLEGSNELKTL